MYGCVCAQESLIKFGLPRKLFCTLIKKTKTVEVYLCYV